MFREIVEILPGKVAGKGMKVLSYLYTFLLFLYGNESTQVSLVVTAICSLLVLQQVSQQSAV